MTAGADEGILLTRSVLGDAEAWLVGGVVRDRLLGRGRHDVDIVIADGVESAARAVAKAADAAAFQLSDEFGTWRLVPRAGDWQLDISPLAVGGLGPDLARRDFTINALAEPLAGGETIDLHGGLADLESRTLRAVGERAFEDDPLRIVRLARLSCELGFDADRATLGLARAAQDRLAGVAGERILVELAKLLSCGDPVAGIRVLQECGGLTGSIPELLELDGVEQSSYHHLDVWEHTLAVLGEVVRLQADPTPLGPAGREASAILAEPLGDGMTRWQVLRLGALLHDIAKPRTRVVWEGGRVGFPGHDEAGAQMAVEIVGRLRGSSGLRDRAAGLVRNHLVAGFMTHDLPLEPRAVHHYLRCCGACSVDVTVLSLADRFATRGRKSGEAIARHRVVTDELLAAAVEWEREGPPAPLVRGDRLAAELGIEPGPKLGDLLAELEAAAWSGEVTTAEQAVDHARAHLAGDSG